MGRAIRALLAVVAVVLMALPASEASAHTGPVTADASLTGHTTAVVGNSQLESTVDPAVLPPASDSGNRYDVRTRIAPFVLPDAAAAAITAPWSSRVLDVAPTPERHGVGHTDDARGPPA